MYTSLMIDNKIAMGMFKILCMQLAWRGKDTLLSSRFNFFGIIWNPEDQNNYIKSHTKNPAWFNLIKL